MKRILTLLFLCSALLSGQNITLTDSDIAAFYGAVGHGRATTGGRGQSVYIVNTTSDNPSAGNTLREAVALSNRYIIFSVSGTISISSDLNITGSNLTIAGETAPGKGIAVVGDETTVTGTNIIIRHIRFRNGLSNDSAMRVATQNTTGAYNNYMFDHISLSWAMAGEENFTLLTGDGQFANATSSNLTLSNSILSQPFSGKGLILYGKDQTNISIIGNFFAHNLDRNMRSNQGANGAGGNEPKDFEFVNNYIYHYDWGLLPEAGAEFDGIGNVYERQTQPSNVDISINSTECGDCLIAETLAYLSDNLYLGGSIGISGTLSPYLQISPVAASSYTPYSSTLVKTTVLQNAGARNGPMNSMDDLDLEMISDATDGSAGSYVSSIAQTSGIPAIPSATPFADSDGDGLSDEYETQNGGANPTWIVSPTTRPSNATLVSGVSIDQSGVTPGIRYTHIEIQSMELAGDWGAGTPSPSPGGGGGTVSTTTAINNAINAMLIAH